MQKHAFPPDLSDSDILRHHVLVEKARRLIAGLLKLDLEEDGSLTGFCMGFFLVISFSELHPLMVVTLSKPYTLRVDINTYRALNRSNLNSILGSHIINHDIGCYSFRATQWLLSDLTEVDFSRFLSRCLSAAEKGFSALFPHLFSHS